MDAKRLLVVLVVAALLVVGAFRPAGWVFALCVVVALALLAAAVVNGRTWRELGLALPRWVWGGWQGIRSVSGAPDRHGAVRLARGTGVGLVLVIGRWEKDGHLDAPYLASRSPNPCLPWRATGPIRASVQGRDQPVTGALAIV